MAGDSALIPLVRAVAAGDAAAAWRLLAALPALASARLEEGATRQAARTNLAGAASRFAALLLPQILPVFSVVAPCDPGAGLRDLVLVQPRQATSDWSIDH